LPKDNDFEGVPDQGGKHGGQAGVPKPPPHPNATKHDPDVVRKDQEPGPTRGGKPPGHNSSR
jgi:hypothetical protein